MSEANTNGLLFPVLPIATDGSLRTVDTKEGLETCNNMAMRNGYYNEMLIVDSNGAKYRVAAAERGEYVSSWRPFRGRLLRVHLHLNQEGVATLLDVQNMVCTSIEAHRDFWAELDEIENIIAIVRATKSIPELMRVCTWESAAFENVR